MSSEDRTAFDAKLAYLWERFALWLVGIMLAVAGFGIHHYNNRLEQVDSKFAELDAKITHLQSDKVSRQELREMKSDILSGIDRLERYLIDRYNKK